MASKQKQCCICGVCTATIFVIVILATTFKVQNETDVCLEYDTITRVIDPQPSTTPGTKALGPFTDILCYPKTIQKFEFSKSGGTVLRTRTKEGLSIGLDVTIEYKFLTANLKNLFDLTGPYPSPTEAAQNLYRRVALRTIINVASQYPANAFLSEQRGNISSTMATHVNLVLMEYHAVLESLQMRNIALDTTFVEAIDDILGEKLQQAKLVKERDSTLATAYKARQVQTQQYVSNRQKQEINLKKDISSAISNRVQENILVKQVYEKSLEEVESRRVNKISNKKGLVLDAKISRNGILTKGENDAAVLAITMSDLSAVTIIDANSKIAIANAEAIATVKSGEAKAAKITYEKDAEADHYGQLLSAEIGMHTDDVLRHAFLSSLEKKQQEAKLFVGYKKVPILSEAGKDVPLMKKILP
jgi:hypothetical protein